MIPKLQIMLRRVPVWHPPLKENLYLSQPQFILDLARRWPWSEDMVDWTTWNNGLEFYEGIFSKNESWIYGYNQTQGSGLYKSVDGLNTFQKLEFANSEYPISMVKNK